MIPPARPGHVTDDADHAPSGASTAPSTAAKGSTGGLNSSEVAAATRECKQIVGSQAKLPSTAKAKLEAACGKAAKGDTAAVKKAAREVCEEVIDKSALPGGAAKEAALSACKK